MAIELLQHALERFGVVTVMEATLYDTTGKPVLFMDTLKMSNITSEGQEKTVKGGKFADTLLNYNYGRSVKIEFQDALLSFSTIDKLWGGTLDRVAANITINKRERITAANVNTLTTAHTIASFVAIYDETTGLEVAATGTGTTITATGLLVINHVYQAYYTYAAVDTGFNPVQALIKSNSFPKLVKFIGKSFFIEQASGKQIEAEIEIPRLQLNSNFTLTMEAEGDASVFDFGGTALADATHELIKIKALRYLD
jgi:hypothetical protein